LSKEDQATLFGAVPYTTVGLGGGEEAAVEEQERQVESMKRILDLRNASKSGIEVVNRQRIVEEFGRKRVLREEGVWGYEGEPQSGGSEVQGMLNSLPSSSFLFYKINGFQIDSIVSQGSWLPLLDTALTPFEQS